MGLFAPGLVPFPLLYAYMIWHPARGGRGGGRERDQARSHKRVAQHCHPVSVDTFRVGRKQGSLPVALLLPSLCLSHTLENTRVWSPP